MREILFRGKRKDTGEWIYGSLQCFKGCSIFDNDWKNFISVVSKTVGQYTGLKDKHGTKIFEGDIVKFEDSRIIRSVIFDERYAEFEFDSKDPVDNPDGHCLCIDCDACEVIGNVYDNPEILEVKNDV